jgi:hypothetical protein
MDTQRKRKIELGLLLRKERNGAKWLPTPQPPPPISPGPPPQLEHALRHSCFPTSISQLHGEIGGDSDSQSMESDAGVDVTEVLLQDGSRQLSIGSQRSNLDRSRIRQPTQFPCNKR